MVIFLLPVMIMELNKRCKDTGFKADKPFFSVKKQATVLNSTVAGKLYSVLLQEIILILQLKFSEQLLKLLRWLHLHIFRSCLRTMQLIL